MQTFTKAERLSGKIAIEKLVKTGKSLNTNFFKIIWLETVEGSVPAQIVITVPKRSFKKAVDRNRLKRIIREAYRKNKDKFYVDLKNKKVLLMFIYTPKTIVGYKEMEEKIIVSLKRLSSTINS